MLDRPITVSGSLREQLCIEHKPTPSAIVIFGASGDLTKRKLLPAIYSLYERRLLPKNFAVIGVARTSLSDAAFQEDVRQSIASLDGEMKEAFISRFSYVTGAYDSGDTYTGIKAKLESCQMAHHTEGNVLFYLATPPSLFEPIVKGLSEGNLLQEEKGFSRVIIEKPFGHDLDSAIELDKKLKQYIPENQVYRIDHYLGKETVQNILILRFANAIFEPLWNREHIDSVEITVAESLGIGSRAGYYDESGALRDMFQNHMMQMLALIAMEPPAIFKADPYRDEIVKLMRALRPMDKQDLKDISVRAQYDSSGDGSQIAYRKEQNVGPESKTETYVALRLMIDNWRWKGVPFFMRTGKSLKRKKSEIAITFKKIPHSIFTPIEPDHFAQNVLVLRMQPEEGMGLTLEVKSPGSKLCVNTLEMNFSYSDFIDKTIPDAYERLILDALLGDQTLFVRNDAVEASWRFYAPLLKAWEENRVETPLFFYESGSEGPEEAKSILKGSKLTWRPL